MVRVTERGYRLSRMGRVLQIKVWAPGYPALSWDEVWQAFSAAYPGRWAFEVYPPADRLVNGKNVYHLWVPDIVPWGLDLLEP